MLNKSGIYKITCVPTGKVYIGSAVSFKNRWAKHRNDSNRNEHHSQHFQKAWNKYGESSFEFSMILLCAKADLIMYEQRALDAMKPRFNIRPTAGSALGTKWSLAAKKKRSGAGNHFYGKTHSADTIEKMTGKNNSAYGKAVPEDRRRKISAGLKGIRRSDETKVKMSATRIALGLRPSESTIAKAASVCRGKKASLETRVKMSMAMKGRIHSEDALKKLSATKKLRGQRPSTEASRLAKTVLARKIEIGEVEYDSIADAARALGVGWSSVGRWLRSGVVTAKNNDFSGCAARYLS